MQQSGSDADSRSLLTDALRSVTQFVSRRPKLTLWLVLITSCACAAYTIGFLKFKTDRSDLIDPSTPFQQRWLNYTQSFGESSDLVAVVEADDPAMVQKALEALGTRVKQEADLFSNVLYKVEPGRLREKGLQYLSPEQLQTGLDRLAAYRPILAGNWNLIRLDSLVPRLRLQLASRIEAGSVDDSQLLLEHTRLLATSLDRFLNDRNDFENPWPLLLPLDRRMLAGATQSIYLMNEDGTMGFLKATPLKGSVDFQGSNPSIDRLRDLIATVTPRFPGVKIGLTGIPVLESDEMRRSQLDMQRASVISFLGVALVQFLGFRGFRHPVLALIMLAVGMAWAFGYATLAVGHLNILSVSFAAILIGLGADFAICYLARYLELRQEGRGLRPALVESSTSVGPGVLTSAITTALAFFCASFTPFLGVAELGIIGGGGILMCLAATFIALPALIALSDRNTSQTRLPHQYQATLHRALIRKAPAVVCFASIAVIIGITSQAFAWRNDRIESRVIFDHNLLNLQADGLESVMVQKRAFSNSQGSLLFAISLADSAEEARQLKQQFEALPSVHHVEDLASRLPLFPEAESKALVQRFREQLANLPAQPSLNPQGNPKAIGRALDEFYRLLNTRREPAAREIAQTLDHFLNGFERLPLPDQMRFLMEYQMRVAHALLAQFRAIAGASNPEPVSLADLPESLTSRFVSAQGKWLLQVYPKDQIWDMEPLRRFVEDVRAVDPEITGTPLQNFEAAQQIKQSYENSAMYALAVVCIALLMDFLRREHLLPVLIPPLATVALIVIVLHTRRMEVNVPLMLGTFTVMTIALGCVFDIRSIATMITAVLPTAVGMGMMFGFLGLLKVNLNPANLIVLPLMMGIGVDSGVHIMHDFRSQRGRRYDVSASLVNAILVNSVANILGFGSMMVAAHRGLYSLGLVLSLGVTSCLFVSLVTLPALLTWVSGWSASNAEAAHEESPPTKTLPQPNVKKQARAA